LGIKKEARRKPMLGDENFLTTIKMAGVNALSIANNHLMEYGTKQAEYTIQRLKENGFLVVGEVLSPFKTIQLDKSKVEILAADILPIYHQRRSYRGKPLIFSGKMDEICAIIAQELEASQADMKIVYLHWGEEFISYPDIMQINWAHKLVEAGANVVVGSHSHIVQQVELFKGKPIVYSLGNFISDMYYPPTLKGIIFSLDFDNIYNETYQIIPYVIDNHFRPVLKTERITINKLPEPYRLNLNLNDKKIQPEEYRKVSTQAEKCFWKWVKIHYRKNFFKYPLKGHWGWLKEKFAQYE
jgi:poly-gamma-glutamate synthesis protein (capsule biosynthesis protein)